MLTNFETTYKPTNYKDDFPATTTFPCFVERGIHTIEQRSKKEEGGNYETDRNHP